MRKANLDDNVELHLEISFIDAEERENKLKKNHKETQWLKILVAKL